MQYVKSVWGKNVFSHRNFLCIPWGNKGFGNLKVNFVRKKIWIPTKTIHQLSITDDKMLILKGKIGKAWLFSPDRRNSRNFFKLGAWRTAKTRACLLRFSALYNSIETRRTCFQFPLENTTTKKRKQRVCFDHENVTSLCSCHHNVNSSCYSVFLSSY